MPKGNGGKDRRALVIPGARPMPPPKLTRDEGREWKGIVDRMPQDWFPAETHPVLVDLCRIIVNSDKVNAMVNTELGKISPDDKRLSELMKLQMGYSKSIGIACAKLRITPQARYAQSEAKHRDKTPSVRPWKFGADTYADIRNSASWGDPSAAATIADDD
jgi:hypothetical protein